MNTTQWWVMGTVAVLVGIVLAGCGGGGPDVVAGLDGGLVGDWLMLSQDPVEPSQAGEAVPVTLHVSAQGEIRLQAADGSEWLTGTVEGAQGSGTVVWTNCSVHISQLPDAPLNEPIAFTYQRVGPRITLEYEPEVGGAQGEETSETYVKLRGTGPIMLIGTWLVAPPVDQQESWDSLDFEMVTMLRDGKMSVTSYEDGQEQSSQAGEWVASWENEVLWKLTEGCRQCSVETDGGYAILDFGDEQIEMHKRQHDFAEELANNWTGEVAGDDMLLHFGEEGGYRIEVNDAVVEAAGARSCCYGWLLFDNGQLRWAQYELSGLVLSISQWHEGIEEQWVLDKTYIMD